MCAPLEPDSQGTADGIVLGFKRGQEASQVGRRALPSSDVVPSGADDDLADGASQLKALEREVASLRASRGALQSELDRLKNDKAAASGNAAGSWTGRSRRCARRADAHLQTSQLHPGVGCDPSTRRRRHRT